MFFRVLHEDEQNINERAKAFYKKHLHAVYCRADRIFLTLMPIQWIALIVAVYFVSPYTWQGAQSSIHPHVWEAVILGGLFTAFPLFFVL
ncbi:MAG TPA: hypothetical protein PKY59_27205 [Pyrinomonadaceae bacterium]|nr:hypothetical protein [Pyrinomonadaceae bacterium]